MDCSWCHGFTRPERGLDTQVTPDIRANGEDGPITVSRDTAVSITVALDPGRLSGTMMDWWVAADTPTPRPRDGMNGMPMCTLQVGSPAFI
ncbi:MAG: hypothetical protein U5R49_15415 [Deltaproteobacteria bacterium]|nr:hypothetical protein [Deltaproteobacteria bacterium]